MAHRIVARCWVMPFDNYDTMTIKGTYLNARYFSSSAYDTNNGTLSISQAASTMRKSGRIRAATTLHQTGRRCRHADGRYFDTGQTAGNT